MIKKAKPAKGGSKSSEKFAGARRGGGGLAGEFKTPGIATAGGAGFSGRNLWSPWAI